MYSFTQGTCNGTCNVQFYTGTCNTTQVHVIQCTVLHRYMCTVQLYTQVHVHVIQMYSFTQVHVIQCTVLHRYM